MEEGGRAKYFILSASFLLIAALILYRTFSVPLLLPIEISDVSTSAFVSVSAEAGLTADSVSSELNTEGSTNGNYLINIKHKLERL